MTILITGGAGFIGSHVVRKFANKYPDYKIVNLDILSYAGNLENIKDLENLPNYSFIKGDITDLDFVRNVFNENEVDAVIHLAAESHVDRSILDPLIFIKTNVLGTTALLQAAKEYWNGDYENKLFYHVSTDEVYGSLGDTGLFTEETAYDPRSPYSSSKASSDHIVRAWFHTYGFPIVISNCSNNYGPNQFPEKLIPLFINNIIEKKDLPVYGEGINVRDWLYVVDHADAIDTIFHNGKKGETYNIGGHNEWKNIDLIKLLIKLTDQKLGRPEGDSLDLIKYVKDRAGHDLRYAIDASKLSNELNWNPSLQFEEGLSLTIDWYLENKEWLKNVTSGKYQDYYNEQYFDTLMIAEFFDIPDLILLKPKIFQDHRGYFIESFNSKTFKELTGKNIDFIQDNESSSNYGTLRGIHYQKPPYTQSKLVRVIKGEVLDIVVDLREGSPTYGSWKSFVLNEENKEQLFVPKGFGHAFLVLSKTAIFSYKVDEYYHPESDSGILWNDSDLEVDWKIDHDDIILSEKDTRQKSFDDYSHDPDFKYEKQ